MATRTFQPPLTSNSILLTDLENAATLAKEFDLQLPMASRAAERYRLLAAQGRAERDPAELIDLMR